ncbi:hypothetical protein ACLOJK_004357 [Asimina triloba]
MATPPNRTVKAVSAHHLPQINFSMQQQPASPKSGMAHLNGRTQLHIHVAPKILQQQDGSQTQQMQRIPIKHVRPKSNRKKDLSKSTRQQSAKSMAIQNSN